MTPAEAAAQIMAWYHGRAPDAVARDAEALAADDPVLAAADALADAADSDDEAQRGAGIAALFAGVVEPLSDSFSVAGRALYARIFPRVCWRVSTRRDELRATLATAGVIDETGLRGRYAAVRAAALRPDAATLPDAPRRIAVLSRVTIGADIALTSIALQRLRERFPHAELLLLGDAKLQGLFGGFPGLRVVAVPYRRRGPLGERLLSWAAARAAVDDAGCDLVLSPDSRVDQLGVLPMHADPARHLLWENLQTGEPRPLAELLDAWCCALLAPAWGRRALPRVFPDAPTAALMRRLRDALGPAPIAAVKLDHGGNPAKALPRAAELLLLRRLRERGWRVLIDRGFGAEELANSDALLDALGWSALDLDEDGRIGRPIHDLAPGALAHADIVRFHGSIAGWAAALSACGLSLSYDSVGQHLAAALGVPTVVAFTGYADPAFATAWAPQGAGRIAVVAIPTAAKDDPAQWERVAAALPKAR